MMTAAKDTQYWDRSAARYAKSAISDQAGYDRTLNRIRSALTSTDHVLELGCGTGATALQLASGVASYLATDISSEMIGIALERRAAMPIPHLQFETATADSLTGTNPFSAIIGLNYLHLVRDLPNTLRRIHTLLAPGGVFISKTPCINDMNPLFKLALPLAQAIGKAPYVRALSSTDLVRQLDLAGFEILTIENHASKGRATRPFIVARKIETKTASGAI